MKNITIIYLKTIAKHKKRSLAAPFNNFKIVLPILVGIL